MCYLDIDLLLKNISILIIGYYDHSEDIPISNKDRISHSIWLENKSQPHIINTLLNLMNQIHPERIDESQLENIQIARYQSGQKYKEHYDICHPIDNYPLLFISSTF